MLNSTDSKILAGLLLIVILIGGIQMGKHQGFADGYTTGESRGSSLQRSRDIVSATPIYNDNTKLTQEYNQLSENYNNLRSAVIKYVGATQYQASKPVTCNTDTYFANLGSITTTCD